MKHHCEIPLFASASCSSELRSLCLNVVFEEIDSKIEESEESEESINRLSSSEESINRF